MRFLESAVNGATRDIVLLAPAQGCVPSSFTHARVNHDRYSELLHSLQRLRGRIYLEDGAIQTSQLTSDGRHRQDVDEGSWHILAFGEHGELCGCARYRHYPGRVAFDQLGVRRSAIAQGMRWGSQLRTAVEIEIEAATRRGLAFAEVGGWAISAEKRCTAAALRIAFTTYALAQALGGSVGLTTATMRHHSSAILRRIGGRSLTLADSELPPYYDPQYRCRMEMLRFDSGEPDTAYRFPIERLQNRLPAVSVVAPRHEETAPRPAIAPPAPAFTQLHWIAQAG